MWTRPSDSVQNRVAASCEHGNEHRGSAKGVKCPEQLSDIQLLRKGTAPLN